MDVSFIDDGTESDSFYEAGVKTIELLNSTGFSERAAAVSPRLAPSIERSITLTAPSVDDLSRNVFGVLGVPIDAIDFNALLRSIESAVGDGASLFISTPNVNFMVASQSKPEFRQSLLLSDLCLADGMPLIWIAKLLRIPIYERIAGSDLFGRLKSAVGRSRRLKIFLIGGADGVAETVAKNLNSQAGGLECVGYLNPGFGTVEELSKKSIIDTINQASPDLLAVFFGAEKAQAWLMHNHRRLNTPIRAQFGATINFEAGTVKRAPHFLRSTGFEWLWRIKEEPYLWRRYWTDGKSLLVLLATCVLPLMLEGRLRWREKRNLRIDLEESSEACRVALSGDAILAYVELATSCFRNALESEKQVLVDLSNTRRIDSRFFGLFLMVRKRLESQGKQLRFAGISNPMRRQFRLNRFEFLLSDEIETVKN